MTGIIREILKCLTAIVTILMVGDAAAVIGSRLFECDREAGMAFMCAVLMGVRGIAYFILKLIVPRKKFAQLVFAVKHTPRGQESLLFGFLLFANPFCIVLCLCAASLRGLMQEWRQWCLLVLLVLAIVVLMSQCLEIVLIRTNKTPRMCLVVHAISYVLFVLDYVVIRQ